MAIPTQLAYRTSKGIGLFNAAPVYEPLPGFVRPEGNLRCCCYSPDSKYFAWASPEQVSVIDASAGHVITTLPTPNVFELGFSPLGTYIITWQRPSKDEEGNAVKNLKVWRTVSDEAEDNGERPVVGEYVQKNQQGWNLQYTSDEKFCARAVTNEVQFFQSDDLRNPWNKLRVEGVTDFAVSPGKNHSVAVFVPERKGMPAAVKVFQVPQFGQPMSQKTFFKGDKVQLKWNELGTSLIVLAQTEVDKTNKSYYGETNMYILSANGTFDSRIQLDKEGPIHDVSWSPNSKEFGVTYGYMPAKTTIFNQRAVAQHSFDLGPRNTISFSPHGRFVIVAGFGNLAGDMDIYDLEKNFAKVCTVKAANCTYCEWSPDGQHILTATTSPRLRVDNGVRIYHVSGGLMYNEEMTELYHVTWRPQPTSSHPVENALKSVPTPHPSALAFLSTQKTPSKPAGAYRPPGARGTTTPLLFKREDEGGAAYTNTGVSSTNVGFQNGFGKPRRREVPGAEAAETLPPGAAPGGGVSLTGAVDGDGELSKAALKNKKKREAKKAREAADKAAGLAADGINPPTGPANGGRSPERRNDRSQQRSRSKNGNEGYGNQASRSRSQSNYGRQPGARQEGNYRQNLGQQPLQRAGSGQAPPLPPPIQTENQGPAPDLTVTSPGDANPQDKKIRGLLKKMRAIDELKMRQAGGEKLEDTQVKKIGTEHQIKKELDGLGFTG
ncbi:eukaryotic translation initiation factor-like protein subunit eIF2A [Cucurbitaria berberidis CBS 394.84]|uniref:Eukaryotic translation initiation factor 2A n=1 Tax=Cucurbitaria berberidis CBS 394.84 TaxID=1168544 RepID=A0A9P4L6J9_9PLEO|nr:eukaryotic translation initiation factor-like protein subunit eIF2A [Cucurbitaria berberidis CBS 394.84]KAF1844026.1 eukaryotic translation initiation factor-like protein subunit eIF2A [Cucurbitaria berberidis CBS 394.84]